MKQLRQAFPNLKIMPITKRLNKNGHPVRIIRTYQDVIEINGKTRLEVINNFYREFNKETNVAPPQTQQSEKKT